MMKPGIKTLLTLLIVTAVVVESKSQNVQKGIKTGNTTSIFPQGDKITNGYFTGNAYLQPLLTRDKNHHFVIGSVTFEPGARTNWHSHPRGQVLLVTEGNGLCREKGKPARRIKKGDVINTPENTPHWHGATQGSKMVHIAITNYQQDSNAVWLEAVTDQEYSEANKQ